MSWRAVVRDALSILFVTFLSGLVLGFVAALNGKEVTPGMIALSNIVLLTIGFGVSGSLTRTDRLRHLFFVAVLLWLLSLVNLVFGFTFVQWAASGVVMLICGAVGGGASALLFPAKDL